MFKTLGIVSKLCGFMIRTAYTKLFYSKKDFFNDLFLRLHHLNLIIVKILQCSANNHRLWCEENRQLLQKYTDNVPYNNDDIDYKTIFELIDNKNVKFNDYYKPIHSGTISLVYDGIYKNNKVIIKIKRKNIEEKLNRHNEELQKIIFLLKWIPYINKFQIEDNYDIYKPLLESQCDFQNEIKNQEIYTKNFSSYESLKIPVIYKEICNENSIVMEYINGFNISQIHEEDKNKFMDIMGHVMVHSLIIYGFFHCDAHPGNIIFIKEDNKYKICMIDFGICGKYNTQELDKFFNILSSISNSDYNEATALFLRDFTNCSEYHESYRIMFEQCRFLFHNSFENIKEFSFSEIYFLYKILKVYNVYTNELWMKTELAIASIDSCMKELKYNGIGLTDILKNKVRILNELQNSALLN